MKASLLRLIIQEMLLLRRLLQKVLIWNMLWLTYTGKMLFRQLTLNPKKLVKFLPRLTKLLEQVMKALVLL